MSFSVPTEPGQLLVLAKVAEQCERYDEMLVVMRKYVKSVPGDLTEDEKNLLSVAYKNVIGSRRAPWRTLANEQTKAAKGDMRYNAIETFKTRLTAEIGEICADIFGLLKSDLIPKAESPAAKVFYYKLEADYHRYYVEVLTDEGKIQEQKNAAGEAYATAVKTAKDLADSSAVKLGLLLNYSVFQYEIQGKREEGYNTAKAAFEDGLPQLEALDDDDYRESATIMSLLRDNIQNWSEALNINENKDDQMEMEDC